ncbi:MAK10-like protein [Tanacetum coccineum]
MGDENPIRTLGDYSKPSHEGYRNTIELPEGNNVVHLRFDTIRLVQNGCSFHGLRSEDPYQHLKEFLKLVDSLDLDLANRERTCLRLFQFSLHDQFFPPRSTAKLRNDILMFQQHQGESLSEAWTHFKDLLQKVPHHGIDLWLQVQIFYDHVNPATRRNIDQSAGGKLRDRNAEESWALLKDLVLYDNESWNDPRDFAKLVKAISLPLVVPSTSDRRLIELKNQVQRLMEAHLAPKQLVQVNKITSSCEICSGPHDTQCCMENSEQAFVEYASSRNNEMGGNPTAQMNFASADYPTKEELRSKEIKSPSKLLSLKYLSQSSLAEQNRNPSSLKRIHFVKSIIILNKEDEANYGTNGRTKREEHLIRIFVGRGNKPDPCDVNIISLKQRIQELEFSQLQQDSPAEEAETESKVWDDRSEDVNPFGEGNPEFYDDHYDNPFFQEEPIVLVKEESCPIYDTDNEEEESMPVYDTDIEDVIEEEEEFIGKGGFDGEEDNIEDVVVVASDLCSSMIQTILSVDFEEDINTKSHELMSFEKELLLRLAKVHSNF